MGELPNQIVQGVLVGGLYAMYAMGLSLSVGVMRFVNIAHGDMIVLASFAILALVQATGMGALLATLALLPVAFGCGYMLQRFLLQKVLGKGVLPIILVTFGLSIIIQNGLLGTFGADTRRVSGGGLETATLKIGAGINIGLLPLAIFAAAVLMVLVLDRLLYRSSLGARIRAVSDDPATASLVGLPSARVYATAMGIVGVTIAISAGFMSIWTNFDPTAGPSRLLIAFEAVVLGGLGSLWGTLVGGIVIGVAQALGAQVDVGWQLLAGHIAFLVIFLARPEGLFPKY